MRRFVRLVLLVALAAWVLYVGWTSAPHQMPPYDTPAVTQPWLRVASVAIAAVLLASAFWRRR